MTTDLAAGATYINNALVAKGYINHTELLDFTSGSSRNNARMINTMYALLNVIDSAHSQRQSLTREIDALKSQLRDSDTVKSQYDRQFHIIEQKCDTIYKEYKTLDETSRKDKAQLSLLKQDLDKTSRSIDHLRTQFAAELRKKDIEIEKLKSRLRGDSVSHVVNGIKKSNDTSRRRQPRVVGMLTGSCARYDIPSARFNSSSDDTSMETPSEYEKQLKSYIHTLLAENKALWNSFDGVWTCLDESLNGRIRGLTGLECFEKVKGALEMRDGSLGYGLASGNSHNIAFNEAQAITRTNASQGLVEDFKLVFDQIHAALNSPSADALAELEKKEQELAAVRDQLRITTSNWETAMRTMQKWEDYHVARTHEDAENHMLPPSTPGGAEPPMAHPESIALGKIFNR